MTKLTEEDAIRAIREGWNKKAANLERGLFEFLKHDPSERKGLIGVDTKVRHKGSQLLYTVDSIKPDSIILRTPENKLFPVSDKDFEEDYELD